MSRSQFYYKLTLICVAFVTTMHPYEPDVFCQDQGATKVSSASTQAGQNANKAAGSAVLITNVRIFDGRQETLSDERSVLVLDGLISRISADPLSLPADAKRQVSIDGKGLVLMPGLIDLHCHPLIVGDINTVLSESRTYLAFKAIKGMEDTLMRGFTTIRDAGGTDADFARAANEGLFLSPRIFRSGQMISQTSGHGDFRRRKDPQPALSGLLEYRNQNGFAILADGPDEVRQAVRENLRLGATQIKIMAGGGGASPYDPLHSVQYSAEEIKMAVTTAHDWGTYVFAHAYTDRAILRCIENGVKCVEHANLIDESTARKIKEHDVYVVPTLVTFAVLADPEVSKALGFDEERVAKIKQLSQAADAGLRSLKSAGVKVGFGTDLLGSLMQEQSREFTLRANVYSSADVLRQATSISAEILEQSKLLNLPGKLGVVDEHAAADLLLLDGNPIENIDLLTTGPGAGNDRRPHIKVIIKNGIVVKNSLMADPGDRK